MAQRSTRNKIKWSEAQIEKNLDKIQELLYHMEVLGAKEIEAYREYAPILLNATRELKKAFAQFRTEL